MARLRRNTKKLLKKSRDAAILAVDIYNKPATKFRSHGYIMLMIVAWTSLFHAIFEQKSIKYYYRQNNGRYEYKDGEKKAWDLSMCAREYFKGESSSVHANLELMIKLRNKIEHRFLPALDLEILGQCHSLLLNYEKLLTNKFGSEFSLGESLAIPIQLLTSDEKWKQRTLKELQSREYVVIKEFIDAYAASLDESIRYAPEYNFRIFLVPNLGNRESSSDIAVQFVRYDPNRPEQMEQYRHDIAFIKTKLQGVANQGKLKPGEVVKRIRECGIPFSMHSHTQSWKKYNVRPPGNSDTPESTNIKYCQYDTAHKDYVYTEEWVDFLVAEYTKFYEQQKAV